MEENKELNKFITELEVEITARFNWKTFNEEIGGSLDFEGVRTVKPFYSEEKRAILWEIEVALIHKDGLPYEVNEIIVFYSTFTSLNVVDNAIEIVGEIETIYDELNYKEDDFPDYEEYYEEREETK